jgi:hypothetical protein
MDKREIFHIPVRRNNTKYLSVFYMHFKLCWDGSPTYLYVLCVCCDLYCVLFTEQLKLGGGVAERISNLETDFSTVSNIPYGMPMYVNGDCIYHML